MPQIANRLRVIDNHPTMTYLVAAVTTINTVAGGVVAIVSPDKLSFQDYAAVLAINTIGIGLVAIGRGINEYGRQEAGSRALAMAFERKHRPQDPEVDMTPPHPGELAALDDEENPDAPLDATRWRQP